MSTKMKATLVTGGIALATIFVVASLNNRNVPLLSDLARVVSTGA